MACLVITSAQQEGTVFHLSQAATIGGRGSGSVIRIRDLAVSRQHFEIARRPTGYTIRELASKHGVYVNRARIRGEHVLTDGDEIKVGNTHLKFHSGAPAGTPSTPSDPALPEEGPTRL